MTERRSSGHEALAVCVRGGVSICLANLLFVGSQAGPVPARASAEVTDEVSATVEIPMELLFSRPLVRGSINGKGPFGLLIDPLRSTARIDGTLAALLELPQNEHSVHVKVGFDGQDVRSIEVEVSDAASVVPELGSVDKPHAVLGLTAWADHLVTFDYRRWQVRIEPGELPEPDGREVFNLDPISGELRVPVTIGNHVIMCRVDPWFPAGVALPLSDLARLPLDSAPTDVTLAATRAGLVATREARVAEPLMVAGTALPSQLVLFGNVGKTGIVGYRWLAGLSLTYDVTHGRARLAVGRPGDSTPEPGDEGMVNLR